jgi:hypothetical protein
MIASRYPRTHHVYEALTHMRQNEAEQTMIKTEGQTVANREDTDAENPNGFKFNPALLRTESKEEFEKLFDELKRDVEAASFIERMYVYDIAVLTWEILRYRRDKTGIINADFHRALTNVLRPIMQPPQPTDPLDSIMTQSPDSVAELTHDWFNSQKSKDEVCGLLNKADLDMRAVEAEAVKLNLANVEKLDRLLAAAEGRREKAFHSIAWYRKSFAKQLRQSSDGVLAAAAVPKILSSPQAN